jgi:hypothetical protein
MIGFTIVPVIFGTTQIALPKCELGHTIKKIVRTSSQNLGGRLLNLCIDGRLKRAQETLTKAKIRTRNFT